MIIVRIYSQLLPDPIQYVFYTHLAVTELFVGLVRAVTALTELLVRAVTALTVGFVLGVTAVVAISYLFLTHTQGVLSFSLLVA